jgi:hypothetical protein
LKKIIFVFILIIPHAIFPNDSRTIMGSSVEIIDNENTNIVMQDEEIIIKLHRDFYEVEVTFNFFNTGEDEIVSLGFPVESHYQPISDNREWAVVNNFKSYINGGLITEYEIKETTRRNGRDEYDYITHTKWYIRKVLFPANQITVSKVFYEAPYGHGGFTKSAGYIFGTGYNWKGPIGKITIKLIHEDDLLIESFSIGRFSKNNITKHFTWEGDGRYKIEFHNIEPIVTDEIRLSVKACNMFNATGNEFGDSHMGWIWDECLFYKNITDLYLFTKNQIRLFINFFYAIHGYNFQNKLFYNFFSNLKWLSSGNAKYRVNNNFSENDFNEFERKNIDYLLRLEKMIP